MKMDKTHLRQTPVSKKKEEKKKPRKKKVKRELKEMNQRTIPKRGLTPTLLHQTLRDLKLLSKRLHLPRSMLRNLSSVLPSLCTTDC